jgi:hypothetical protein
MTGLISKRYIMNKFYLNEKSSMNIVTSPETTPKTRNNHQNHNKKRVRNRLGRSRVIEKEVDFSLNQKIQSYLTHNCQTYQFFQVITNLIIPPLLPIPVPFPFPRTPSISLMKNPQNNPIQKPL